MSVFVIVLAVIGGVYLAVTVVLGAVLWLGSLVEKSRAYEFTDASWSFDEEAGWGVTPVSQAAEGSVEFWRTMES